MLYSGLAALWARFSLLWACGALSAWRFPLGVWRMSKRRALLLGCSAHWVHGAWGCGCRSSALLRGNGGVCGSLRGDNFLPGGGMKVVGLGAGCVVAGLHVCRCSRRFIEPIGEHYAAYRAGCSTKLQKDVVTNMTVFRLSRQVECWECSERRSCVPRPVIMNAGWKSDDTAFTMWS